MSKLVSYKQAKFVGASSLDGMPLDDWFENYKNKAGLLLVFSSESQAPGKNFVYFYPSDPENDNQPYFHTSMGDLIDDNSGEIHLRSHRDYCFKLVNELDDLYWTELLLNTGVMKSKFDIVEVL